MSFSRVARIEIPLPVVVAQGRAEERDGEKEEGERRLLRNKEPPVDELILPDDSRGYGPAGVWNNARETALKAPQDSQAADYGVLLSPKLVGYSLNHLLDTVARDASRECVAMCIEAAAGEKIRR